MTKGSDLILIADDDAVTRMLLDRHLREAGYRTRLAADGDAALEQLAPEVALAIFDLQMPQRDGLECLQQAKLRCPQLPVLVISQFGKIPDAVEAMKRGATDYISKPIDPDELRTRVEQALAAARLATENQQLRQAIQSPMAPATLLGSSPAMDRVRDLAGRVAGLHETVLITGDSGTGKSTLARMIHQRGPRSSRPFVLVSCAALPRDLIEAELFGHRKGAFTGAVADRPGRAEVADTGTLFLDEVGDLPLELQPKLLTFLQDRELQRIGESRSRRVDVRVIAATNQDLVERIRAGLFREDLYFRLNVLPIEIPSLVGRTEDILELALDVLERVRRKRNSPPFSLSPAAQAALLAHPWPGNVRELENVLERSTAFASGSLLEPADLGPAFTVPPNPEPPDGGYSLAGRTLADIERQAILDTLASCGGNKRAAARQLGIDEKTIYNKMKRFGLLS